MHLWWAELFLERGDDAAARAMLETIDTQSLPIALLHQEWKGLWQRLTQE
jgi:hypothetical protein